MKRRARLLDRYGPWAVVAGASEGLGQAFAEQLAAEGFNLLLVARRQAVLENAAAHLRQAHGADVRCLAGDLGTADTIDRIAAETGELDVGLLVYNAAFAPIGPFADTPREQILTVVDVNVRGPLDLVHRLLPRFRARGRGGVLLMSSLSGVHGSPRLATYSASKAFTTAFAEALWHELRDAGVDVTACVAGAVRTPGLTAARDAGGHEAPGTLDADMVARVALRSLGRGPTVVPGAVNRIARFLMERLLPTRAAVGIMARSTAGLDSHDAPAKATGQQKMEGRNG